MKSIIANNVKYHGLGFPIKLDAVEMIEIQNVF